MGINAISMLGTDCAEPCGPLGCNPVTNCTEFRECFGAEIDSDYDGDFEIAISGVTNDTCATADCADFNTTYLYTGPHGIFTGFNACLFADTVHNPDVGCRGDSDFNVRFWIGYSGGLILPNNTWILRVEVEYNAGAQFWRFQHTGASAQVAIAQLCGGGTVTVPYEGDHEFNNYCTFSGATVTFTAIP